MPSPRQAITSRFALPALAGCVVAALLLLVMTRADALPSAGVRDSDYVLTSVDLPAELKAEIVPRVVLPFGDGALLGGQKKTWLLKDGRVREVLTDLEMAHPRQVAGNRALLQGKDRAVVIDSEGTVVLSLESDWWYGAYLLPDGRVMERRPLPEPDHGMLLRVHGPDGKVRHEQRMPRMGNFRALDVDAGRYLEIRRPLGLPSGINFDPFGVAFHEGDRILREIEGTVRDCQYYDQGRRVFMWHCDEAGKNWLEVADARGKTLWTRSLPPGKPFDQIVQLLAVALDAAGRPVMLLHHTDPALGPYAVRRLALDDRGEIVREYSGNTSIRTSKGGYHLIQAVDKTIIAFRMATGEQLWEHPFDAATLGTLQDVDDAGTDQDQLYLETYADPENDGAYLRVRDLRNGRIVARFTLPTGDWQIAGSPDGHAILYNRTDFAIRVLQHRPQPN